MSSILVAGLPKSGTTGLYNAVKSAVPAADGYAFLFEPKEPQPFLALGRYAPYRPILAKVLTTRLDDCAIRYADFDRRIMTIRDPRDIAVSRLLFRPMYGRTAQNLDVQKLTPFIAALKEKEADPSSHSVKGLHDLADTLGIGRAGWEHLSQEMHQLMRTIDEHDFFTLHYEGFVDHRLDELSDYLGLSLDGAASAPDDWTSYVQRSMGYGDWKHWFLDEDVKFFGSMFAEYMRRFGYGDWERAARPRIDPETSSDYIAGKMTRSVVERQTRGKTRWNTSQVTTREQLHELMSMAEDGRAVCGYRLACLYSEETAFGPNRPEALRWARHTAQLGDTRAMALVARLLAEEEHDRECVLEARFWRREHDRLTDRQRTTARATRKTRAKSGDYGKQSRAAPKAGRQDRPTSSPRRLPARVRRQLDPLLRGTVRDSPRNARLVLRDATDKVRRRVRNSSRRGR